MPSQENQLVESSVNRPTPSASSQALEEAKKTWREAVAAYQEPDLRRTLWQAVNSIGGYVLLVILAYKLLPISYWLVLPIQVLAAGFLIRVFIIFHDCGHGSFFKSNRIPGAAIHLTGFSEPNQREWGASRNTLYSPLGRAYSCPLPQKG